MSSHKSFKTKIKLAKATKTCRPVPMFIRIKGAQKYGMNLKRRNWRRNKLKV